MNGAGKLLLACASMTAAALIVAALFGLSLLLGIELPDEVWIGLAFAGSLTLGSVASLWAGWKP